MGVGDSSVDKVLATQAWDWSSDPQNPNRNRNACICNPNIKEAEVGGLQGSVASWAARIPE